MKNNSSFVWGDPGASQGFDMYKPLPANETRPDLLLQPNIVKPLHGTNPRTLKGREWWDIKRQEAYAKFDYHCIACGVHKFNAKIMKRLEAHESFKIDVNIFRYTLLEIVPLCPACHNFIHSGRLSAMVEKGAITEQRQQFIINHGTAVLKRAGLTRAMAWWNTPEIGMKLTPERTGEWDKWHLVIEGESYFSKFKDYLEWHTFYANQ